MEQKIRFEFESKMYETDMDFYDVNRCTLPDGRLLMANGWLESMPPRPSGLTVVRVARAVEVAT